MKADSEMEEHALTIDRLSYHFGEHQALNQIGIDVKKGEIFGLIGPDGAGKTTTLRLVAGALKLQSGEISIDGTKTSPKGLSDEMKLAIGYMPQQFSVYRDLSVDENLRFFADLYGIYGKSFKDRREELLTFSRLSDHRKKRAGSLSGGMQKKLALSCSLFHKPKLLLLDEPTNGVDPVSRRELWGLLYDLVAGETAIVVSTAYMDEAERCSRIALLHEGSILTADEPNKLIKKAGLQDNQTLEGVFIEMIHRSREASKTP